MNMADARKYASRFMCGLIEQQLGRGKTIPRDPFVYDFAFGEHAGKRMSRDDKDRVEEALMELQAKFDTSGKPKPTSSPAVDGKPGARWKSYRDQRKRQGFEKP
jgi:hypothetical protein